jgi:predicted nucleic acid-binding protein
VARLIDASVLITLERQGDPPDSVLESLSDDPTAIAAITASEMLTGVARSATPSQRAKREAFVEGILAGLPVVPFDVFVARVHAQLWADMASTGQRIGLHDLIIAATALAYGYDVVTENTREFERVPDLTVHQPEWPFGGTP